MDRKQQLLLDQIDRKLRKFQEAKDVPMPSKGWIYALRTALNMTQKQIAVRLGISKQYVSRMENNEPNGGITLQTMREVAHALDMQFVYAIVPREESLQEKLKQKAHEMATEIVQRTSQSMALEDQEVDQKQLAYAIEQKTEELMEAMPKYLWD